MTTAVIVSLLGVVAQTSPTGAADCVLEPQMWDTTVTQGLGSYTRLTQEKETLVRFYLEKPACATRNDVIELTGGTLTVSIDGTPVASVEHTTPPLGDTFAQLPPAGTGADNAASDPIFVVPAEVLTAPLLTLGRFDVSLQASITFRANGTDSHTPVTFRAEASVEDETNALRMLVVAMGDDSAGDVTEQFPQVAVEGVAAGMANLSRLLPVREGIGRLGSLEGGIRYDIAPQLLDLGPEGLGVMPAGGPFCGGAESYPKIKEALAHMLQAWNDSANPQADTVLGVIWDGVSDGAEQGCADGWATVPGKEAWSRVITEATSPWTGTVFAMELAHNLGSVDPLDDRQDAFHSENLEADLTAPDRGHNVTLREVLLDDLSVMNYTVPGWTDENTLYEAPDWNRLQCVLTPAPLLGSSDDACPDPGSVGFAAAAASTFSLSGSTDGTTADIHSYFSSSHPDEPDADSDYRLVQRDEHGRVLRDDGVPVHFDESSHDDGHGGDGTHAHEGVVDVAIEADTSATHFQFWHGDPLSGTATLLYERQRTDAPQITGHRTVPGYGAPRNLTASTDIVDSSPAVSDDGTRLAWVEDGAVRIRRITGAPGTSAGVRGGGPTWSHDGSAIAYVRDGSVYRSAVSEDSSGNLVLSDEQVVYDVTLQSDLLFPSARHPDFSPDDTELVVTIAGDLWAIGADPDPLKPVLCKLDPTLSQGCRRLTSTSNLVESTPDWRPGSAQAGRPDIAYTIGSRVHTLEAAAPASTQVDRLAGVEPAWSQGSLVVTRADGLVIVDTGTFALEQLLFAAGDSHASLSSDASRVVFARGDDVMTADEDSRTVEVTVEDDEPGQLRADFFAACTDREPPVRYPIAAAQHPVATDAGGATFRHTYRPVLGCARGRLSVRVTDGWSTAETDLGGFESPRAPVGAIYGPGEVLQYDEIPVAGAAIDDEGEAVAAVDWYLSGPGLPETHVGSGWDAADVPPPLPDGWPAGDYTLRLVVSDVDGRTGSTEVVFPILADTDHDNMTDAFESTDANPCFPDDAATDPTNAWDDPDGDGFVNVDDPAPCESALNATVDFDPNTLYVPSSGDKVAVYVSTAAAGELAEMDPDAVRIAQVAGYSTVMPALSYEFDPKRGMATVHFDRQLLNAFLEARGLVGHYVPIYVVGRSDTFSFRGTDPEAPVTAPG